MSFTKEVYMKTVEAIVEYSDKNLSAYIDGAPIAVVGDSISEIEKNMREAVSLYVESCKELGIPVADILQGEFELKFTFLQLSHLQWCHRESNQGHKDFQSFALPTEL